MSDSITMRLAVALAGAMGLMLMMEQWPYWQQYFEPVNSGLAQATELVLRHMHIPVARHGSVLAHPEGFSYRITYVCSGLRPAVLILVTLLAVPASWMARVIGVGVALVGIEALNLLRLAHLYWTGVANPDAFEVTHRVFWNAIAIAAVIVFLTAWLAISAVHGAPREHVKQL